MTDLESMLPEPCAPGCHIPCIVHRTGGISAELLNACGKCGRQIERTDCPQPWMTEAELNSDECIRAAEAKFAADQEELPW